MKFKIQLIIVVAGVLGLVMFLASRETKDGESGGLMRFPVDRFLIEKDKYATRPVLLMGMVEAGTIRLKGDTAQFGLTLNGKSMPIDYNGADGIPDTFKEGAQALLEGKLNADGSRFQAYKITTKCASKYEQEKLEIQ